MNRTDRLLAIVLELQAKGWLRAEDLAAHFEISKRTIYRDMQALGESGVPVISSPGQGYSLMEGYFLPPLNFTTDEAIVLLLGSDFMAQNFDAQYQAAARSSVRKIEAVLTEKLRTEVRDLQMGLRFILVNPLDAPTHPGVLQQIRRAIIQRKTIHFEYHARSTGTSDHAKTTMRDADPYALIHVEKAWHLTAYCHLRQDIRHFRLDRIEHLKLLDKTFIRPIDFDSQREEFGNLNLIVRALFSPNVARWVLEEPSFYAVSTEDCAEGLIVTFKTRHETDLLDWLLKWGRNVRVLEPESLRQRLIEEAHAILQNYESLLP